MRRLSSLVLNFVLLAAVGSIHAVESTAVKSEPIQYQPEVAPVIAEALGGFPAAKQRFQKGLPRGSELHVLVRLVRLPDTLERVVLAQVRVTKIDEAKAEIIGRIANQAPKIAVPRDDKISVAEAQVVDWTITHRDGSEEGGVFARYLASKGEMVDVGRLLEDEEGKAKRELLASPELARALEESFLKLFDDPTLKFENVPGGTATRVWPALAKKFDGVSPSELSEQLVARTEALKTTIRAKVAAPSMSISNGRKVPLVGVSVFVVLKRGRFVFEVQQYLHFQYDDKDTLEEVVWGANYVRSLKLKK